MAKRKDVETIWGKLPATKKARRAPGQMSFAQVPTWGGRRDGAGRKRGPRPNVAHRARSLHDRRSPVHVTLRRAKGLPSLRNEVLHRLIREAVRETARTAGGELRIAHYSIQADHVHLVVEGEEHRALSSGLRSFVIRVARRINKLLGRRGRVWGDRHHRHELTCPSEVRKVLVYVLSNHIKHGETSAGLLDPCSSGPWWDGWIHVLDPPAEPNPVQQPETWLLQTGWRDFGGGYVHLGEVPRAARCALARR